MVASAHRAIYRREHKHPSRRHVLVHRRRKQVDRHPLAFPGDRVRNAQRARPIRPVAPFYPCFLFRIHNALGGLQKGERLFRRAPSFRARTNGRQLPLSRATRSVHILDDFDLHTPALRVRARAVRAAGGLCADSPAGALDKPAGPVHSGAVLDFRLRRPARYDSAGRARSETQDRFRRNTESRSALSPAGVLRGGLPA